MVLKLVSEDMPAADFAGHIQKLVKEVIKRAELKDELYMQIVKATRCNPTVPGQIKAWETFYIVAAILAPSREFIGFRVASSTAHRRWIA